MNSKKLTLFTLLTALFCSTHSNAVTKPPAPPKDSAKKNGEVLNVFYRFLDEKGGRVVSNAIPPDAVPRGYEILDSKGNLIKTIAPLPADNNPAKIALEKKIAKEQAKADLELRRNYSTPQDIDAAKARNLKQLRDTFEILQGSLVSTRSQLKLHETNAANIERAGKVVPDDVLKNINTLRAQEKNTQELIRTREQELKQVSEKFDKDKERFILITKETKPAAQ